MRPALVFSVLLAAVALPGVTGTSPQEAYELSWSIADDPELGKTVVLEATVLSRVETAGSLGIRLPPGIGTPGATTLAITLPEGEARTFEFPLAVAEPGFWGIELWLDLGDGGRPSLPVLGYTGPDRSFTWHGRHWETEVLPSHGAHFAALDQDAAGKPILRAAFVPQDPWMAHGKVHLEAAVGSHGTLHYSVWQRAGGLGEPVEAAIPLPSPDAAGRLGGTVKAVVSADARLPEGWKPDGLPVAVVIGCFSFDVAADGALDEGGCHSATPWLERDHRPAPPARVLLDREGIDPAAHAAALARGESSAPASAPAALLPALLAVSAAVANSLTRRRLAAA